MNYKLQISMMTKIYSLQNLFILSDIVISQNEDEL